MRPTIVARLGYLFGVLLLIATTTTMVCAQSDTAFFDYMGTTNEGPYDKPCEVKDTVERAAARDLIASADAGDRCSIALFLRADVRLTILNGAVGRAFSGSENVSIFLSSRGPGYYAISDPEYRLQIVQESNVVAVAINQTVDNIFGPGSFRQDIWQITYDHAHRVAEIIISLGDLAPQLVIAADPNPILDPANSLTCGAIHAPYISCIGKNGRCKGYEAPCQFRNNTLLKAATEYIRANMSTNGQYRDLYRIVGNNSLWTIPPINATMSGPDAMVSYFLFGDPAAGLVDPLIAVVNSSSLGWIQNDDLVLGITQFYFYAFQTGVTFNTYTFWYMVYEPNHYLYNMVQSMDSLIIITNVDFYVNYTVEHICGDVHRFCYGPNEQFPVPYGPYQGLNCTEFIGLMPDLAAGGLGVSDTGFSRSCRAFHLRLTPQYPTVHCDHVGGKPDKTPCIDPVTRSASMTSAEAVRSEPLSPIEQSALEYSMYVNHVVKDLIQYASTA